MFCQGLFYGAGQAKRIDIGAKFYNLIPWYFIILFDLFDVTPMKCGTRLFFIFLHYYTFFLNSSLERV